MKILHHLKLKHYYLSKEFILLRVSLNSTCKRFHNHLIKREENMFYYKSINSLKTLKNRINDIHKVKYYYLYYSISIVDNILINIL